MYKKLLFSVLLSCLFLSTIGTGVALVQVGVSPGDTFYYEVSGFGIYPKAVVFETEYLKVTIISINGSRVLTQNVIHLNNGTEAILKAEYDLASGGIDFIEGEEYMNEAFLFLHAVEPANLNPNDRIYPFSEIELFVSGAVRKSYSGAERETNFFSRNSTAVPAPYYYVYDLAYFDKTTGALVERYYEVASIDGQGGFLISLTQSSVWVVPEFPSFIVLPSLIVATLVGVLLFKRKRQHTIQKT
jgi:hypothetical protein